VHTLNFEPYRVDLTPFASILSNGQQHTVAVSVFNADSYFSATATLLLYQDMGSTQITGALTTDTIGQPDPVIAEHIQSNSNAAWGTLSVTSNRGFTTEGYVQTSHGTVDTKVVQSIDFSNGQRYYVTFDGLVYDQAVLQSTTISSATTTRSGGSVTSNSTQFSWPLAVTYDFTANPDGSFQQASRIRQGFNQNVLQKLNNRPTYYSAFSDSVAPTDTLIVDANGNVSTQGQANTESYQYSDSSGSCWNQTVTAAGGVLTSVRGGSCSR
jgi:hypothetical protein